MKIDRIKTIQHSSKSFRLIPSVSFGFFSNGYCESKRKSWFTSFDFLKWRYVVSPCGIEQDEFGVMFPRIDEKKLPLYKMFELMYPNKNRKEIVGLLRKPNTLKFMNNLFNAFHGGRQRKSDFVNDMFSYGPESQKPNSDFNAEQL